MPGRAMHSLPILLAAMSAATMAAAEPPVTLRWPVDCTVGVTCAIQHYVDHGHAPPARDYRCGTDTYAGHDGTDIRLPTLADERAGVAVRAAADGTVLRTRDDMADVSVRLAGEAAVQDRECGNGLVVGHKGGFETQYCHMARGSLAVRPGEAVTAGQILGRVGLSGNTEFPHLHFTVRHDGVVVDPFAYGEPEGACEGGVSLWQPALGPSLRYQAGVVLNAGFAARPLTMEEVENGAGREPVTRGSPAIVAFVRSITLRKGDVQRLVLTGPQGPLADRSLPPLEADKAQYLVFVGRRQPPGGWPPGLYQATFSVTRDGAVVIAASTRLDLPPGDSP